MSPFLVFCTLSLTGLAGFSIGTFDPVVYEVTLDNNGWGPQQYYGQPFCDRQKEMKIFSKNTMENTTILTKTIWHTYCKV